MFFSKPKVNEKHARCAARILRYTSLNSSGNDEYQNIADFTARLLHGEKADYSLLLSAQEELIKLGGNAEFFDDIRLDFLH